MMTKEELREKGKKLREAQQMGEKQSNDAKIFAQIISLKPFVTATAFFTYLSNENEVSTDALIEKCLGEKTIIVPKIGDGNDLCLHQLKSQEGLQKGRFGIREPAYHDACLSPNDFSKILCAFIPGIAFDLRGHRIGFGGGYFDRLLKKLHCTTIGLAYEFQIIDKVPTDLYDVAVDFIVTEKRIICCNKKAEKLLSA